MLRQPTIELLREQFPDFGNDVLSTIAEIGDSLRLSERPSYVIAIFTMMSAISCDRRVSASEESR